MITLEIVLMFQRRADDDATRQVQTVGVLPERVVDAVQDRDHAEHI